LSGNGAILREGRRAFGVDLDFARWDRLRAFGVDLDFVGWDRLRAFRADLGRFVAIVIC